MKKLLAIAAVVMTITACQKDDPQPPQAAIQNPSGKTTIEFGETLSLKASVVSPLPATIAWSVDGVAVAGATSETFEFKGDKAGEREIALSVTNADGVDTDKITVTVNAFVPPPPVVVDFEDATVVAGPTLACENFYSEVDGTQYAGYISTATGFMAAINPTVSEWGNYWNGVAVSKFNDMETGGLANQCSVYYKDAATGTGGQGGSANFAVSFEGAIELSNALAEAEFHYMWVTNATYTALSMMNGDAYAKKFSYEDEDWLLLTISATDAAGEATGEPREVYLADFREAGSPGILTEWEYVDLKQLGNKVHKISFVLSSSDTGEWGMNTPGYFCFDTVAFLKQ
jgi:PKD repeat protein